jgi:hypothetical protein
MMFIMLQDQLTTFFLLSAITFSLLPLVIHPLPSLHMLFSAPPSSLKLDLYVWFRGGRGR